MGSIRFVLLSFAFSVAAWGQQRSESQSTDADSTRRVVIVDPGIALGQPILLLPPSLERDSLFILPSFLLLGEDAAISQPFSSIMLEKKIDLMSPLRLRMEKESRLRPLRMVLGTVQVAGAAYLAYRHVKKYGFLR